MNTCFKEKFDSFVSKQSSCIYRNAQGEIQQHDANDNTVYGAHCQS